MHFRRFVRAASLPVLLMATPMGWAAAADGEAPAVELNPIQVTATREAEPVDAIPAFISVVSGAELEQRGANDLRTALSLLAGVDIAPGGDGGPAAAVPALWGLREFDAFLLVVDGVPWGGAFNPALASLTLTDIDRIEVLRGSAPVMYGATAFVGVIHVIHRPAGEADQAIQVSAGSFDSYSVAGSMALPGGESYRHSLAIDGASRGFVDRRAGVDRGHLLYRFAMDAGPGELRLDLDASRLRQNPNSPHLREGPVLAPDLPLDANYNPADARLDENRYHGVAGYDRPLGGGDWSTLLAVTSTRNEIVRGFLDEEYVDDGSSPNAAGFSQDRDITDVYFDTHLARRVNEGLHLTYGLDYLYGHAEQTSDNFDYYVAADGSGAPASGTQPIAERFGIEDRRNFYGLYLQADWKITGCLDLLAGIRLNRTEESRQSESDPGQGGDGEETNSDRLEKTRPSGLVGLSWRAWERQGNFFTLYANYRNTYKPAAIDFGPESEAGILEPETAYSFEAGFKSHFLGGRLDVDFSAFDMHFDNLVVTQSVNGRPGLTNAGEERFKGLEVEARYRLTDDLLLTGTYAWHDARFGDYERLFDGVPTQLRGNRLEMSPEHLGGLGLLYQSGDGWRGSLVWNYVGSRYLNKRNTASAPAYHTLDASIGRQFDRWRITLAGYNLGDERPPVAESELGESQYYRLPARSYEVSVAWLF